MQGTQSLTVSNLKFILSLSVVSLLILAPTANAGLLIGHRGAPTYGNPEKIQAIWTQDSSLSPADGRGLEILSSSPFHLQEDQAPSLDTYEEILLSDSLASRLGLNSHSFQAQAIAGSELRTIIEQGPPQNRICLTFLGDGYTESEKERYFADVARLTQDLFTGSTFASYLPLFNVYAVFTPSQDSGITDGSIKKQTAFGLYRTPAGSKRAIMPGNSSALENALKLAPKTDYPIVVANDEFYGGLGGRYAITTRSLGSGTIVLRHELGHNFGNVGEEYDGGGVYSGANSSRNASNPSWAHWIQGTPRTYEMKMLDGQYVWKNLSTGSVRSNFTFPNDTAKGSYWFDVQLSSVGWETPEDVHVLLDGQRVSIEGKYTEDRSFFKVVQNRTLKPGAHTLEVKDAGRDRNNILAFANLYAYEADYAFDGTYGSFMTYDQGGNVSYRPTHEQCLMRDMTTPHFCAADKENMWIKFIGRMNLIDSLTASKDPAGSSYWVTLAAPQLTGLGIRWYMKSSAGVESELTEYRDQREFILPKAKLAPELIARVEFNTSEVMKPTSKFKAEKSVQLMRK